MIDLKLVQSSEPIDLNVKKNTSGGVNDVQVNGTSIVKDGVADIPKATKDVAGVVKVETNTNRPVYIDSDGLLQIARVAGSDLDNRNQQKLISGAMYDHAVRKAMCDGKGAEWTTEEKANARERMGLEWTLLGDVTVEEDGVTKIEIPIDNPNYNEYQVYIYVNRVSNPSSNTLVVNFGELTTSSYALLTNGVGTKTEVYLRSVIQRHANNGWISWCVSSHDKQVLTGINGRGGQYSESWNTKSPSKINVSLATGLDIGSRFIVYAR